MRAELSDAVVAGTFQVSSDGTLDMILELRGPQTDIDSRIELKRRVRELGDASEFRVALKLAADALAATQAERRQREANYYPPDQEQTLHVTFPKKINQRLLDEGKYLRNALLSHVEDDEDSWEWDIAKDTLKAVAAKEITLTATFGVLVLRKTVDQLLRKTKFLKEVLEDAEHQMNLLVIHTAGDSHSEFDSDDIVDSEAPARLRGVIDSYCHSGLWEATVSVDNGNVVVRTSSQELRGAITAKLDGGQREEFLAALVAAISPADDGAAPATTGSSVP